MQAMTKNKYDVRLYDFVKEKIKKYLQQHHYKQIFAPCGNHDSGSTIGNADMRSDISKVYFFRQCYSCNSDSVQTEKLILATSVPSSIIYDAYLIAMIDNLLRETLKIEYCALKINIVACGKQCLAENLCNQCKDQLQLLQETLMMFSVSYVVDATLCCPPKAVSGDIINSLEEVKGTVFTFTSRLLGSDTIFCSGGRVHRVEVDGNFEVQCSIEKVMTLVGKNVQALMLPQEPVVSLVIPTSSEQYQLAALFTQYLQHKGRCVDLLFPGGLLMDALKQAEKMGTQYVLLLGPEEQENGTIIVKNLLTGQFTVVKQAEFALIFR